MCNLCMPWVFGKFLKALKKLLCLYLSSILFLNVTKCSGNFYRNKGHFQYFLVKVGMKILFFFYWNVSPQIFSKLKYFKTPV